MVVGTLPGQLCGTVSTCQNEQKIFVYEKECVKECPTGTKKISYIDGGVECRGCPTNQHYQANTDSCECDNGFTRRDGTASCDKIELPGGVVRTTYARTSSSDSLGDGDTRLKDCLKMTAIQQSNSNVFVTLQASSELLQDKKSG